VLGTLAALFGLFFIWDTYEVYQSNQYCNSHPNSCWNFPQPQGWEQQNLAIGLGVAFALMVLSGYLFKTGIKPKVSV
jgi:hypothetical protein